VFNTDQCENLPGELVTAPSPVPECLILPQAEALIAATDADPHRRRPPQGARPARSSPPSRIRINST
jgi:hypothetical protein